MQAIERIKDGWKQFRTCSSDDFAKLIDHIDKLNAELERLRKDAERYQWIKSAKGLTLESERGSPWTREDGSAFTPSHRLCAGGTQFAPNETLDDAIDAAMKGTP